MEKGNFIEKARKVHRNRYDYSLLPDTFKTTDKIKIICPVHGVFEQRGCDHLQGRKCRKCKYEKLSSEKSYTVDEFIKRAKEVHGNKYDYSKVVYTNSNTKVCIICHEKDSFGNEHGEFWQTPNAHLQNRGCPKCKKDKLENSGLKNAETFFKKCKEKHNGKYSYDKSIYRNNNTKMLITCPIHGDFWQTPKMHFNGCGCPKCSYVYRSDIRRSNTEDFIQKARKVHGDKYDYSKVEYIDSEKKVCIICPKHGEFWQFPSHHLYGYGCDKCAKDKMRLSLDEFIERARKVHGDKYDYSKVEYTHSKEEVCIICPEHGEFWQVPNSHLNGNGCPKCACNVSKSENEIYYLITSLIGEENVVKKDRTVLKGKELDIYIPSLNIAFEFNGIFWHSECNGKGKFYHLDKTEECSRKGIKLIHIFEDEYNEHKDIVLSKIKHIISKSEGIRVGGRNTEVKEISVDVAKSFLNKNHIQGFSRATVYLGAFKEKELVAVMTFVKAKNDTYELNRYASNQNYVCCGVASKLFKHFIKTYVPKSVKSFADRRWTPFKDNNLYSKLGFSFVCSTRPDYRYVINGKRIHKFNCRKERLHKKYGLPMTMTENEMVKELGFSKIWDCGLIKYVWEK